MIECYDASPSDSLHQSVNRPVAKRIYWQLDNKFLKLQGPKSKVPNANERLRVYFWDIKLAFEV